MTKTKEEAKYLLEQLASATRPLVALCSEFNFDNDENRHVYSKIVADFLGRLFISVHRPIYEKYPELHGFGINPDWQERKSADGNTEDSPDRNTCYDPSADRRENSGECPE